MELAFSPSFSPDAKKTCYKIVEVKKHSGFRFNLVVVKGNRERSSLTNDVYQKVDCK